MILVRPRKFVEQGWNPYLPTAVISITTPGDPDTKIPDSDLILDVHRTSFHDVSHAVEGKQPIQPNQAGQIAEFIEQWSHAPCLLVHCDAGISRSPAVAAAAAKYLYDEDSFFFINYVPNLLVYREVLTILMNSIHGDESELVI